MDRDKLNEGIIKLCIFHIEDKDKEIAELKADKQLIHAHNVDDLLGKRNADYYELLGKYNELKTENVTYINDNAELIRENDKLKAEVKQLKADIIKERKGN